jgi:tripeptide aminopeptidase
VGLIAHLDTSSDYNGCGVTPVIHENYDGNDIVIGDKVIETSKFTHLKGLVGRTIITSNGDSLLGADDKAGIA